MWAIIGLMIAAAVLCVLIPLSRKPSMGETNERAAVYEEQYRALEGEEIADPTERARIGRHLLSEIDGTGERSRATSRKAVIAASIGSLVFLPGFTLAIYAVQGSPGFEARMADAAKVPLEQQSIESLVARAEAELAKNPDDIQGWSVLADVYRRTGQEEKLVRAWRNIIRLGGENSAALTELAEAQARLARGFISQDTLKLFERAVKLDATNMKARAFTLVAMEQSGDIAAAIAAWEALGNEVSDQSPVWKERIAQRVAMLRDQQGRTAGARDSAGQPGPDQDDINAAQSLTPRERTHMIEGMVSGLARRLRDEPDDVEGWIRLIRSYHVLNRLDDVGESWRMSSAIFGPGTEERNRIVAMLETLGYKVDITGTLLRGASQ
ncbi:MAG: c-type cytochrome biogenesis protein CcmI [Ahrensia sp.]|nr:c-type cytochrome biogenesis protein CcmI [Ahrensia sp.]